MADLLEQRFFYNFIKEENFPLQKMKIAYLLAVHKDSYIVRLKISSWSIKQIMPSLAIS